MAVAVAVAVAVVVVVAVAVPPFVKGGQEGFAFASTRSEKPTAPADYASTSQRATRNRNAQSQRTQTQPA
jgi:hypothetical protein